MDLHQIMTTDYALPAKRRRLHPTKSRSRHLSRSPAKKEAFMPPWAWMSAGLLLGMTLSGLVYWKTSHQAELAATTHQSDKSATSKLTAHKTQKNAKAKMAAAEKKTELRSRFDFYTVLPNLGADLAEEVVIAEEKNTTPKTQTAKAAVKDFKPVTAATVSALAAATRSPSEATLEMDRYIIQAGSFKQYNQAEQLKARLAFSGFQARIQAFKLNERETWYRVYIGPFDEKRQAESSQRKLEQAEKRHSLVLKMRV